MPELEEGRFFFNAVKEGDSVIFASEDENECHLWVMALYRATGQSHKPTPLTLGGTNSTITRIQGDADRARKHGMDEFIAADPCNFNHHDMLRLLQSCTLTYRIRDTYCSHGWFSPGQIFVLDEYCARYGVRSCFRHLCYIYDLLDFAEAGTVIDPTLIHYSFAFCSSRVHGHRFVCHTSVLDYGCKSLFYNAAPQPHLWDRWHSTSGLMVSAPLLWRKKICML